MGDDAVDGPHPPTSPIFLATRVAYVLPASARLSLSNDSPSLETAETREGLEHTE